MIRLFIQLTKWSFTTLPCMQIKDVQSHFNPFSAETVFIGPRQILTYKDRPCTEIIKHFLMDIHSRKS